MKRDWGFLGPWQGLQSRSAFHNLGCAISENMEHVRYFLEYYREATHGHAAVGGVAGAGGLVVCSLQTAPHDPTGGCSSG
jgi:hypothetical protein